LHDSKNIDVCYPHHAHYQENPNTATYSV